MGTTHVTPVIQDCKNVHVTVKVYHGSGPTFARRTRSPPAKSSKRFNATKQSQLHTRVSTVIENARQKLRGNTRRQHRDRKRRMMSVEARSDIGDEPLPEVVAEDYPSPYDAETENDAGGSPKSEGSYADHQPEGSPVPAGEIVPEEFPLDVQDSPIGDEGLPTSGENPSSNDDGPGPRAGSNDSLFAFLSPDAIQSLDLPEGAASVDWEEDGDAEGAWPTELGPEPLLRQRLEETSAENAHEVHVDTPDMDVDYALESASVRSLTPMSDESLGEFSELEDEEI